MIDHLLHCHEETIDHLLHCHEEMIDHLLHCLERMIDHLLHCLEEMIDHLLHCHERMIDHLLHCLQISLLPLSERRQPAVFRTSRRAARVHRYEPHKQLATLQLRRWAPRIARATYRSARCCLV